MNDWPPKPGSTVITRTMSSSSAVRLERATAASPGLIARPAARPASRIRAQGRLDRLVDLDVERDRVAAGVDELVDVAAGLADHQVGVERELGPRPERLDRLPARTSGSARSGRPSRRGGPGPRRPSRPAGRRRPRFDRSASRMLAAIRARPVPIRSARRPAPERRRRSPRRASRAPRPAARDAARRPARRLAGALGGELAAGRADLLAPVAPDRDRDAVRAEAGREPPRSGASGWPARACGRPGSSG